MKKYKDNLSWIAGCPRGEKEIEEQWFCGGKNTKLGDGSWMGTGENNMVLGGSGKSVLHLCGNMWGKVPFIVS